MGILNRKVTKHIIHCSDSTFGDAATIDRWHKERGWNGIGYHFVILPDGTIEKGRPLNKQGAHVYGHNRNSVGTCLIGKTEFTPRQFEALQILHNVLEAIYGTLPFYGHRDYDKGKTCPNFEVKDVL